MTDSTPIEDLAPATSSNSATSTPAQILLLAAQDHNISVLRSQLATQSPNIQDHLNGHTPLHVAIAFATTETQEEAEKTVKLLLQNGAIWNTLDYKNETPGCIARRLGLGQLYDVMVDAGVRAELLLSRLEGYQFLAGGGSDDEDEDEDEEEEGEDPPELVDATRGEADQKEVPELVVVSENGDVNSADYLRSELQVNDEKILDEDLNGVMMSWETPIMEATAALLLPEKGKKVLNIGFGMGIIDKLFQSHSPAQHHIVEAHPSILPLAQSFASTYPNVTIHEGRWQDVLPALVLEGTTFDAIYFDTFAEDYSQLRIFFEEFVVGLMDSSGLFGFFNGLGADRQICYDVYKKVVEIDLMEAGLDVSWTEVDVNMLDVDEWKGVRRKYFALEKYWLPTCRFVE